MADEVNEQQPVQDTPETGPETDAAARVTAGEAAPGQQADAVAPVVAGEPVEAEAPAEPEVAFSWQASEYVHHQKSARWYAALAAIVVALVVFAVVFHFWLEIGVFIVMGVALFIYASKPPRVMTYELSTEGIHVDGKLFPFSDFRSFSVVEDQDWHSIDLEPTKRFNPRMVLLFDPEDFDPIVSHLELHLPKVDRTPDMIERLTRYLRF